jgi:uncharacterized membrane protein YfcA
MDITVFGVSPRVVLLASLVLVAAGVVRRIIGFGLILTATPPLVLLFSPKFVIAVLIIPTLFGDLVILWTDGVAWQFLRRQRYLFAATVTGTVVGVAGLAHVPNRVVLLVVSGYIFLYLVVQRYGTSVQTCARKQGVGVVAGGAGGLLGRTTGHPSLAKRKTA